MNIVVLSLEINLQKRLPFKRNSINLQKKILILEQINEGEKISSISKSLNLNEATIRGIKRNEEKIRNNVSAGAFSISKRPDCARDIDMVKMEEALIIWIEDCTKNPLMVVQ